MGTNGSGTPHAARPGDRDGTKALIGVLLLHRTLPTEVVLAGIDAAVAAGRCDPDLVAVEVPVDTWTMDGPPRWSRTCRRRPGSMTGRYPRWTGTTTCCRPGHDGAGARFRYTPANFVSLSVAVVVGRGAP
jgi:hypothetical protein